jgi:hypothetical protein
VTTSFNELQSSSQILSAFGNSQVAPQERGVDVVGKKKAVLRWRDRRTAKPGSEGGRERGRERAAFEALGGEPLASTLM